MNGDAPSSVRVQTADHTAAQAANVDGLLVGLSRADGSAKAGKVSVSVDYSSIEQAYGGGWASRLHLVAMPACALTTPQLAQCRTQTPLATQNDQLGKKLTATVDLPGGTTTNAALTGPGKAVPAALAGAATTSAVNAATTSSTAVAAISGVNGSQGNYAATSLSASGSWSQTASGAFTYNVPISVPPALGGSAPSVALSYDSQSIDGETSGRNSQSSWIGDGWNYSPGFIERSYKPCSADGITGSGDECWAGYNATLSLGSHSGQLVRDGNGLYHLQGDDGTKVEDLSGASNGLWNGEYWKVTTTDGTQYYLGLNHAPGTTSDPATNSAWGAPVYMPNSGDPCYDSSKGNASQCAAEPGWRFNLDFVVDPNGNLQRYDWANETNSYNMGYGQVIQSGGGGAMTAYTRGGYLSQISYGYKVADEQAGHDPAAKVVFTPAQRCTTDPTTCQASNLNATTATNWPDTPYDLNCTQDMATSGSGSNVCQIPSPTFWSTYRLQSIKTSVKVGSGWQDVDSYTLTHLFSNAGATVDPVTGATVDPADAGALQSIMWLSQIQHTGLDTSAGGSGNITLDPITFTGIEMDNRVDGLSPPAPPLYHPRISSFQTESGESIAVTYRAPECSRVNNHMPGSPDSDTMACYQTYWTTPGSAQPIADWFQKTLVSQVSDNDATKAGSPAKITAYTYSGGAAWHRDDSDLTDDQYRTWNDFRGYRTVTLTSGAAPDPVTQTVTSYFQGMDGDYKSDGTQRSITLTNSLGESATDSAWLAGSPQEVDTYTQAGGSIVAKALPGTPTMTTTVSQPRTAWTAKSPAPATLSTLPDLTARRIQSASSRSLSLLANGSWRTTQSSTTYDSLGREQQVDNKGDISVPSQETCATTSYANAPASNPMMLTYPSETITVSGGCGTAPGTNTTVKDSRTFYDGDGTITHPGTLGQLGANGSTLGRATASQAVQSYDGSGNPVFQTLGATTYDQYGRVTKILDAAGSASTTSYTPATGTLATSQSTTNAAGWTTTSTVAPTHALATHQVDVNGRVTDSTYDALGRITQVWLPGRTKGTQSPDKQFSYAVHGAGTNPDPSTVTTQTLREDQSYGTSVDIYDGFLQKRQTQTATADNSAGRLISSTHYDSHGWTHSTIVPYADTTTAPGTTMAVETENTLPSETVTAYDGMGRPVGSTLYSDAQQLWTSATVYPGADETDSTPPQGGTRTSVFTNALGQTTSSIKHGGTAVGDVTTSYTYTPAGKVATVKDTVGNTWSYTYDLTGRKTSQTDPDSGTSTTTYDLLGRPATTTDGRGQTLSYTYDQLSRRTGEYTGASTTDPTKQLAAWSYDTLAKGYPTSSTRYVGGASGSAYTQAVTGYNTAYQPAGSSITIPAAEGKLAGTYALGAKYTPNVGLLSDTLFGADGGLQAEDLGYGYDLQGLVVASGSGSFNHYLDVANYSALGQILQSTYGNAGIQLRTAQTYDNATGRMTTNRVSIQTASTNPISATTLGYDQAGNLTTSSELQSSGGTDQTVDTQCYQYDGLDRLTTAWTDKNGITTATAGQLAHCNTSAPSPSTIGGPAAYWQSYSYNLLGDRTQKVQHDVTGNTANDTTQTIAYPGNGTATAAQPNTASSITTTGPTGSSVLTAQYDRSGNTTSRAGTTSGPLVSGLTVSGGGTLCLDDFHSSGADGNPVDIYGCNGTNAQSWTIGSDGTVRVLGKCLDVVGGGTTNGTKVDISTCNGSGTQVWKTATNGSLVNQQSGLCLDDPASTTTQGTQVQIYGCNGTNAQKWTPAASGTAVLSGQNQSFTYDQEGRTAAVTTTVGTNTPQTTGYLYDADGNLLIQRGPSSTILYLFGGAEQLTLTGTTVTGTRYYDNPDGTAIVRSSSGTVVYQPANTQGTAQLQVDANSLAITRRSFDPYGNPRGPVPSAWADNHGYLGKPTDPTTGLDLLGARNYDPAIGRFLTVDPVFEAGDPNQMGGYTYSGDNPTSGSDPTGLMLKADDGDGLGPITCNDGADCGSNTPSVVNWAIGAADAVVGPISDAVAEGSSAYRNFACAATSVCAVKHPGASHPIAKALGISPGDPSYQHGQFFGAGAMLLATGGDSLPADAADIASLDTAASDAAAARGGAARGGADPAAPANAPIASNDNPEPITAPDATEPAPSSDTGGGGSHGGHGGNGGNGHEGRAAEASGDEAAAPSGGSCSFSPDTPVLMDDGSTKPIGQMQTGDKVEAADPTTGKHQGAEPVTATHLNHDTDLVDVTVATSDGHQSTLHTTANHPFFDATQGAWFPAGNLTIGDELQAVDGTPLHVTAITVTPGEADRYNLTVDRLHTYYVLAGGTPVLVHNSCGPDGGNPVYRSDTRDPSVIFDEGFQPKGNNMNLEEHVAGVSGVFTEESGYVATTTSRSHALARRGNTFVIDREGISGGIDVNARIPDNVDAHEMEIAVPHGVDSCHIRGCWLEGSGEWLPNPNYGGGGDG
ncbi:ricin-type beta-trefoil lectin domain protein [Kitasatospora acidiphila]|uniref:ricin-type beta-trefoil lectin domain protein n=1 Tax=Kitasatospora acidiphila TaxID=2567942 RepID=UPI003C783301